MTTTQQILANYYQNVEKIKATEGNKQEIDTLNERKAIRTLFNTTRDELWNLYRQQEKNLDKRANSISHAKYETEKGKYYSQRESAINTINQEEKIFMTSLPKYIDKGTLGNISGFTRKHSDGSYETKYSRYGFNDNCDNGEYCAMVYDKNGKKIGLKAYADDKHIYTDPKIVAEKLGLFKDGVGRRIGAALLDIIPFSSHSNWNALADLKEDEYLAENLDVFRWNAETKQFDFVRNCNGRRNTSAFVDDYYTYM